MKNINTKKNKYGVRQNWIFQFCSKSKKQGFVILIAIVVSALLVSMGIFISNIAYKELLLSTSTKSSQQAFYVADSVMECALKEDIRGTIFDNAPNRSRSDSIDFKCNNKTFVGVNTGGSPKTEYGCSYNPLNTCYSGTFVYYISFADDSDNNGRISQQEIEADVDAPYAKVVFIKEKIGEVGTPPSPTTPWDDTTIKVYGHNRYSGAGVVERALEARL